MPIIVQHTCIRTLQVIAQDPEEGSDHSCGPVYTFTVLFDTYEHSLVYQRNHYSELIPEMQATVDEDKDCYVAIIVAHPTDVTDDPRNKRNSSATIDVRTRASITRQPTYAITIKAFSFASSERVIDVVVRMYFDSEDHFDDHQRTCFAQIRPLLVPYMKRKHPTAANGVFGIEITHKEPTFGEILDMRNVPAVVADCDESIAQ